MILMCNGVQV